MLTYPNQKKPIVMGIYLSLIVGFVSEPVWAGEAQASTTTAPAAQYKQMSFSYLGLGFDSMQYQEQSELFGQQLRAKSHTVVPTLRSGAYTAINADWGFGIHTLRCRLSDQAHS